MSSITPDSIKNILARVTSPDGGDVVSAGMISGIVVRGGKIGFVITIEPKDRERMNALREACEAAVRSLPGVESVTAVMTAQNAEPIPPKPEAGYDQPRERATWNITPVDGVKRIIAIASGKGGVGKSTTSVNLALALQKQGQRVALLDADIYGPSLPRMLGLPSEKPDIIDNKMVPPVAHGIACMSMGFITGEEAAVLRGPMISKTLHQLLRFTHWNNIDTMFVDLPPGTGDIHLSLVQQTPLTGAVIVTTPQQVAVMDARKALKMFLKTQVPVLGVIENMSGGMFGSGGGKALAEEFSVPFLGAIPMDAAIVEASDSGAAYQGPAVEEYQKIANSLSREAGEG